MDSVSRRSGEIDAYILKQSPPAQRALETLRACIWQAAPDLTELVNYGIPAFALVAGGKRDQQVMIAAYARHVGFYPHPDVVLAFATELSPFKSAKGSVQFPFDRPIPEDLVRRMVAHRYLALRGER